MTILGAEPVVRDEESRAAWCARAALAPCPFALAAGAEDHAPWFSAVRFMRDPDAPRVRVEQDGTRLRRALLVALDAAGARGRVVAVLYPAARGRGDVVRWWDDQNEPAADVLARLTGKTRRRPLPEHVTAAWWVPAEWTLDDAPRVPELRPAASAPRVQLVSRL